MRYVSLCRDLDPPSPSSVPPKEPIDHEVRDGARQATKPRSAARAADLSSSAAAAAPIAGAPAESDSLSSLSVDLLLAQSVDQVTELVVSYGMRTLERCLVLLVKRDRALPWLGRGWPCDPSKWSHLSFIVTSEPMFSLLDGEDLYRGPIPSQSEYLQFYRTLALNVPEEMIMVPARVDDRLVALFNGDGGPEGKILGDNNYYRRLARKFGLALSLVESRRRLVSA